jgi:hypothetical protein
MKIWNLILSIIGKIVPNQSIRGSYPSPTSGTKTKTIMTTVTSSSVADGETLTTTISPSVANKQYSIVSAFANNIVGNACTISVHSEVNDGEGAVAGNIRDTKDYDGSETYGGYIGNLTAHKNSHITILNSSGGPLAYTITFTIIGNVNISQSIA